MFKVDSETTSFLYDSLGRLQKKTFSPGSYEAYTYDSRGRVSAIKLQKADGTVDLQHTYTYDASSKAATYTSGSVATTYGYDGAGQLTSESRTGYSASYSYDGNGNRLTRTVGGSTETYSYDDGDKLLSVSVGGTAVKTYGYDSAGRTTSVVSSSGTTTLSYDAEGRAVSISGPGVSQTNSYNGLDTRVSSVTNSVTNTFLRDGAYVTDPVVKDSNASYTPGISEHGSGLHKPCPLEPFQATSNQACRGSDKMLARAVQEADHLQKEEAAWVESGPRERVLSAFP